ncbi:AAA family ATPase [Aureimonas jatrophae]|uniref:Predicted ATPase n=1 Tax=Aureimonas jatrophae TaxID=1166073 RepID=A0A1H0M3J9_9HYPH|nr:DUF3696 domain-containing protein [Aureimonas jatrophae]MBB3952636.1 putative ATPase [Aureimonas jatrophae]SDO75038.1 Predicted ATPase [Aureimonas jatrophae]
MIEALHSLEIEAFKCFERLRVPLAPLTLLTGFNGAGKSSTLQPLLLLAQAARANVWGTGTLDGDLPLNGDLVRLGSAGDVLNVSSSASVSRFRVGAGENVLDVVLTARTGERTLRAECGAPSDAGDIPARLRRLVYLSAVRGGPSDTFPIPARSAGTVPDVGADGRYASYWYHEFADADISPEKCLDGGSADTFRRQVDAWLDRLAPGANANVQALAVASLNVLQFRLSQTGEWRRPANVGYGLTYSFPILVALLAAERGDIVVIDSPEAHLHPQAQSRMGRMLATFAAAGVQILVETHSDHVLNGARLAVRDGVLTPEKVSLLFFSGVSSSGHGVTTPRLDMNGRIDEWPDGFFDQGDKDVSSLAGWD